MSGPAVDITLPSGEQAQVPQEDLQQALAAGAVVAKPAAPKGKYEEEFGGLLGQGVSAVFGAGRTASAGLMDDLLIEGAYTLGGDGAAADMKHGLNVAKETNPYATMGGETAGLFLGAGKGITSAGGALEGAIAARAGEGLLGTVGGMAARGAAEGAALEFGKGVSEEALGDPNANGEKLLAHTAKGSLLGAGIGAGFGLVAHAGSGLMGALSHASGPRPAALLDEVVGTPGAGRVLAEDAAATESLVVQLRKAGATSEQAAIMADEISGLARSRTTVENPFLTKGAASWEETAGALAGEPKKGLSGYVDEAAEKYIASRSGGNPEVAEALRKGYGERASRIIEAERIADNEAKRMAEAGTKMMRAEEVLDRLSFTERPQQFERLMKASAVDIDKAADSAVRMTQMADNVVSELESVRHLGRDALAIKGMRNAINATYSKHAALLDATTGAARESALRDLYMSTYQLKQEAGRLSSFGKANTSAARAMVPTSIEGRIRDVHEFLRTGLEDEAVWGAAGRANRDLNKAFSEALPRREDLGKRLGVVIDSELGIAKPEVDFEKARALLGSLRGGEVDSLRQGVKSAESFVDGIRQRVAAAEQHLEMTAADKAILNEALSSAKDFETTFASARKNAEVVNRLKDMQLEEQGKAIGGTLGFLTDIVTRPVTTMERLGAVKVATQKLEKAIEGGLNRFLDGKGIRLAAAPARKSTEVAKEIGEIRAMAANPAQLQSYVNRFVGDLGKHAPQTADGVRAAATRLITYLAVNAPQPTVSSDLTGKTQERYTPSALASYERKREAGLDPKSVIREMDIGALNRDGIRTVKAVYPQLFAEMQNTARKQVAQRAVDETLNLSREQKKALAALLEVPADGTFEPKFIAAMQASTAPLPEPAPGPGQTSKRAVKIDTGVFTTPAQQIEGRSSSGL